MANTVQFSIFLPTYNGEAYLQECVESILQQQYTNFDLIVLDSGSTDNTLPYLHSLQDDRITIKTTPNRLSIEENWQQILFYPMAAFATIIGQDDIFEPHFLADMVALIQQYPQATLFSAPFRFINANGITIRHAQPMQPFYNATSLVGKMLQMQLDISATGFVFRSSIYQQVGGIPLFPNLLYSDYALWLSITQLGGLAIANRSSFAFRIHSNTSQTTQAFVYLKALEAFGQFLRQIKANHPSLAFEVQQHCACFITHYGKMIVHRVLAIPEKQRMGQSVQSVTLRLDKVIADIGGTFPQGVRSNKGIWLALLIDKWLLLRALFRLWKHLTR